MKCCKDFGIKSLEMCEVKIFKYNVLITLLKENFMKKITFLIVAFWLLSNFAYSQQAFVLFLPKEGLNTAITKAIEAGVPTPQLKLVATTSQNIPNAPEQLKPEIDPTTGKSAVWLYQFIDKDVDTLQAFIGVVKFSLFGIDQFMGLSIDISLLNMLPNLQGTIQQFDWKQTDEVFASILNNQSFKTFATANPNYKFANSVLGLNTINPLYELNKPYWMTFIAKDTAQTPDFPMTCTTNALTGATDCLALNSVDEDNSDVSVYPNPAIDAINIVFNSEIGNQTTISIVDIDGKEIMNYPIHSYDKFNLLQTSFLPNGEYFLVIYGNTTIVKKFIKEGK